MKVKIGEASVICHILPTHKDIPHFRKEYTTNQPVEHYDIVKFDSKLASSIFINNHDIPNISTRLKTQDTEYDLEFTGQIIKRTHHIKVNSSYQPVHKFEIYDKIIKTNQEIIERPHLVREANINQDLPIIISERMISYRDFVLDYVIRKSYYLIHEDEANYQMIYNLAKKLHEEQALVRLYAFNNQTQQPEPLIVTREGTLYPIAALHGQIQEKNYCLRMILADRELRWEVTPE